MKSERPPEKKKLVILGGGFGGYRLALGVSTKFYDVTIVSARDHFLFTPLLASTTVGTTEFRSIIEPLRTAQKGIHAFTAFAEDLDLEKKLVRCRARDESATEFSLPYDVLVIGVGAVSETFSIPGVGENALMIKELRDARRIRQRIINCVERASLPHVSAGERARLLHFVVVGGGATGVEFAGELHDFITEDLKPIFPELEDLYRITLLEAGSSLLSSFSKSLAEYTQKTFRRRKIEVRTTSFVKAVHANEVLLADGTQMPFGALIWSTGVGPTEFIRKLKFPKDAQGRLFTDEYLQVLPGVYAIGDCAAVGDWKYPMTGQLAQQEGKYLSRALNRAARGRSPGKFRYLHLGMFAYIGGSRALADTPGGKWRGFIAWLMWRSIYITKLVSFRNKVRVLFDWCKTSIFGRDVTTF